MPTEFQTIFPNHSSLSTGLLMVPVYHHLYQFYFTRLISLKLWGNLTRASPKFSFFSFSSLLNLLNYFAYQQVIHELSGQSLFHLLFCFTKEETQITLLLPDLSGSAFTCSFCPFVILLIIVIPLACTMCTSVLITKEEKQHRNLHTWCFILCGLPEGTGFWLCPHSCEINVPFSDSSYSIYSHGASVL